MLAFILRRLLQAVIVMLAVAFIAFMLFQYVGDPVTNLLGQDATPEQRVQLRHDLGLDAAFPVQFARFIGNAVQGEFGLSLRQGRKVSSLIVERFPATLELAMLAAVIALVVGIPMGVYTALRRGSFGSQVMMAVSLLGVSLPTFLIGILLILFFAVTLKWLPSFGRGEVVTLGRWNTESVTAGSTRCFQPSTVSRPLVQPPSATTSPRPKLGNHLSVTAKNRISRMPIRKVGNETPSNDTAIMTCEPKLLRRKAV